MARLSAKAQGALAVGGVILVIGFLARKQAAAAASAIANANAGTPFEGTGVVGTLGHATDVAGGGIFSTVGSAIGEFFSGSFFDRRTVDDLTGGG